MCCLQLGQPSSCLVQDRQSMLWYEPGKSTCFDCHGQEPILELTVRLRAFIAWLQTSHGKLAEPETAELLLYAWLAHGDFLPAFGRLRLQQDSMHQIAKFLEQVRNSASSAGLIVTLHANKPHRMGNLYDEMQSPTAAFLNLCVQRFLPASVKMLVLEAMPLQQFPGKIGGFEGSVPPFTHPQRYPPQAWALGELMLHVQLLVLQSSMDHSGLDPSFYFRAILTCGRWACARFCPDTASKPDAYAKPAFMKLLCKGQTERAEKLPCFVTRHPAALAWHGWAAAEHVMLSSMQMQLQLPAARLDRVPCHQRSTRTPYHSFSRMLQMQRH